MKYAQSINAPSTDDIECAYKEVNLLIFYRIYHTLIWLRMALNVVICYHRTFLQPPLCIGFT